LCLLLIPGCISPHPGKQLEQTASLAQDRTGSDLSLEEAWSRPFEDRTGSWDGSAPLDIDMAIEASLRNDPEIRQLLTTVAEQKANLSQASLPPNPLLNFGIGIPIDGMGGSPATVQVMQQITWLWTMSDRIDVEDEKMQARILEVAEQIVDHCARVRASFMNVLWSQELVTRWEQFLDTTNKSTNLIIELANAGELPRVEINRGMLAHSLASDSYLDAKVGLRAHKIELLRHMGWPEHDLEWVAEGDLESAATRNPGMEMDVVDRALTVRLDIAAAERLVASSEAEARLAGLTRLPEAGIGSAWNRNFIGRQAIAPGASVTIPVLDDGSARIAKASARLEAAHLQAAVVREDAIHQTRMALSNWERARGQVFLYQGASVHIARAIYEKSASSFEAGLTSSTELLLAQQDLIEVEIELLHEQYQASIAWIELENAVGGSFDLPLEQPQSDLEDQS